MRELREEDLVARARKGDREAFGELVRRYEKKVFALTRRMCPGPEDAEEAAQEAFLAAWQGLPSFRGEAGFGTWLYRLTSNACVDLLRKSGRAPAGLSLDDGERPLNLPDPRPSPQEEAERAELRERIEAGLRRLPPERREVLILREIHQLRYEEIAKILSLDLGTVKSRISRGRQELRKILLEDGNLSGHRPSKGTGEEGCK